jgi:hypothetical protein
MTHSEDAIPPSQIFRTLLLHFLETQKLLTPIAATTLSKELKWCHQQNVYILSEIGSWLVDLTEATDLTPSFSPAHAAELLAGVVSSLPTQKATNLGGAATTPTVPTALTDLPPGIRRAASSRRRERTPVEWERSSTGQILFRSLSSSAKLAFTLPTLSSDTGPNGPSFNEDASNSPTDPLGG